MMTVSGIVVFFTQYRETPGPVSWRDAAWVPDEPHTGYSFRQKELLEELKQSLREANLIKRGQLQPARVFHLNLR
jgi:hypothetical protein